jgi:hypothetical protein
VEGGRQSGALFAARPSRSANLSLIPSRYSRHSQGTFAVTAKLSRKISPIVLFSSVVKQATTTSFFVEPTKYGWSVRAGSERLALFVTQRQALSDVRKRRAALKTEGHDSTLSVHGSEAEQVANGRSSRPVWPRR